MSRVGAARRARAPQPHRDAQRRHDSPPRRDWAAAEIAQVCAFAAADLWLARVATRAAEDRARAAEARARASEERRATEARAFTRAAANVAIPLSELGPLETLTVNSTRGDMHGTVFPQSLEMLSAACRPCQSGANVVVVHGVVTQLFCNACRLRFALTTYAPCECGEVRWVDPVGLPAPMCSPCKRRNTVALLATAAAPTAP
jgi:hypothetical protein